MACVVLDLASTSFIDATGIEVLSDLLLKAPSKLHVVLANPNSAALDIIDRAGLLSKLGGCHLSLLDLLSAGKSTSLRWP